MKFIQELHKGTKIKKTTDYYADLLHVTPKHLSKSVKQVLGQTAIAVIQEMIILEAKLLLNNLSYSIQMVADKLDFPDQFSFSKFFKKQVGLSPIKYRSNL